MRLDVSMPSESRLKGVIEQAIYKHRRLRSDAKC